MNAELLRALDQIEEEKGIGKEVIIEAIEAALLSAYKKNYGASAQNMRIEVDRETGQRSFVSFDRESALVLGKLVGRRAALQQHHAA